jgi:hypothetical protein
MSKGSTRKESKEASSTTDHQAILEQMYLMEAAKIVVSWLNCGETSTVFAGDFDRLIS